MRWSIPYHYALYYGMLLLVGLLSACSPTCSQDYPPPWSLTTSINPYPLNRYTTNFSILSTRWENVTTGAAGTGTTSGPALECFFPFGCDYFLKVTNEVELIPGENLVYVYDKEDVCEWRDDFLITLQ